MILSCPNCGGALLFDPKRGLMKCSQCGGVRHPKDAMAREQAEESSFGVKTEYMTTRLYSCTTCGASLMINGNEASTFCSYCGQPTIIFDRISEELRPDRILPFAIDEKQAVKLIKEKFRKKLFVPKEIKKLTVDKLHGIYIPHWMYSIHIRKRANVVALNMAMNVPYEKKFFREIEADYDKVLICAATQIDTTLIRKLYPFTGLTLLEPFEPGYLSGFYADKAGMTAKGAEQLAVRKCREYIDSAIWRSTKMFPDKMPQQVSEYYVKDIEYALLPVWFLTFWYKNEIYTVLVNGQTGKIAGSIPADKNKVIGIGALTGIASSIFFSWFIHLLLISGINVIYILCGFGLMCLFVLLLGISLFQNYKKDRERFRSEKLIRFSKRRQDKTWVR